MGVWRLLVASWMLGAAACGSDEPDAAQEPPRPLPEGGCRAGELPLDDGACRPAGLPDGEPAAGVPPEACAAGFEADGDHGCRAVVPERMCGAGKMAVPGDAQCREIGACGAAPFGDVSPDGDTVFADGSYAGADSDGSADKPWTTIQDANAAAAEGATIAVAAGSYQGPVRISGKPVRLRGRCASMVEVVAGGEPPAAVDVRADGAEVRGIAMTGDGYGAILSGATDVLVTWLNDAVLLAPSMLLLPTTRWTEVDETTFDVAFTDRARTVRARISTDERGAPVAISPTPSSSRRPVRSPSLCRPPGPAERVLTRRDPRVRPRWLLGGLLPRGRLRGTRFALRCRTGGGAGPAHADDSLRLHLDGCGARLRPLRGLGLLLLGALPVAQRIRVRTALLGERGGGQQHGAHENRDGSHGRHRSRVLRNSSPSTRVASLAEHERHGRTGGRARARRVPHVRRPRQSREIRVRVR